MSKRVVFSDFDGTLAHKEFCSDSPQRVGREDLYVSKRTIELVRHLQETSTFCIVTGRRHSFYPALSKAIPHDVVLLEHGCLIIRDGSTDTTWQEHLYAYCGQGGSLWDYERLLHSKGFKTDSNGRVASFRVYKDTPRRLTLEERHILDNLPRPDGITLVTNHSMVDAIPKQGGKKNAINYMLSSLGSSWEHTVYLGDDVNDVGALEQAAMPMTLLGAHPDVLSVVTRRAGYISPSRGHLGTIDLLERIVQY